MQMTYRFISLLLRTHRRFRIQFLYEFTAGPVYSSPYEFTASPIYSSFYEFTASPVYSSFYEFTASPVYSW